MSEMNEKELIADMSKVSLTNNKNELIEDKIDKFMRDVDKLFLTDPKNKNISDLENNIPLIVCEYNKKLKVCSSFHKSEQFINETHNWLNRRIFDRDCDSFYEDDHMCHLFHASPVFSTDFDKFEFVSFQEMLYFISKGARYDMECLEYLTNCNDRDDLREYLTDRMMK